MKVFAVIVTYADRFNLLKQVIDASFSAGVNKVIVIDNHSVPESTTQLKLYQNNYLNRLDVVYLDENLGSAGGYKLGLEKAYAHSECEFIWLLDDDNVPNADALSKLLQAYEYIYQKNNEKPRFFALNSFRLGYAEHYNKNLFLINTGNGLDVVPNAFIGFDFIRTLQRHMSKFLFWKANSVIYPIFPISKAPYGGFFCHKSIIEMIGFPNENYFVYADDYEYINRIVRMGGRLYYCTLSVVQEIHATHDKGLLPLIFRDRSRQRAYYNTRNSVHFSKLFITFRPRYYLNVLLYCLVVLTLGLLKPKNFIQGSLILFKAISDGYRGRLGKIND